MMAFRGPCTSGKALSRRNYGVTVVVWPPAFPILGVVLYSPSYGPKGALGCLRISDFACVARSDRLVAFRSRGELGPRSGVVVRTTRQDWKSVLLGGNGRLRAIVYVGGPSNGWHSPLTCWAMPSSTERVRQRERVHLGKAGSMVVAGRFCSFGGQFEEQFTPATGVSPPDAR